MSDPLTSISNFSPNVAYSYSGSKALPAPQWEERHYVMKDAKGEPIGIYKGPIDVTTIENFTLYTPEEDNEFYPLTFSVIHKMDYNTHVAFETLPVLTVARYAANGVLLKFPD